MRQMIVKNPRVSSQPKSPLVSNYFQAKILKKSLNNINLKKIADPEALCPVLFLRQAFFLKAILYVIFMVKCVKKCLRV
jgi:hypothetical protein